MYFLKITKCDTIKMVKYMNTRMDKYKDEELAPKRVDRNKNIYTDIDEKDIEDLNLTSNISIIDTDTTNLDISALKEILDQKYSKKRNFNLDSIEDEKEDLEITKEYDLSKVLNKVKSEQETDYNEIRHKKLRESEYEILNSLNLERNSEPEEIETISQEDATLINLIKTVTNNELKQKDIDDIDILGDLKGDDNTEVLAPIIEDEDIYNKPTLVEELEKTKKLSMTNLVDELEELSTAEIESFADKDLSNEDENDNITKEESLTNSFYTGKLSIKDSDLDDFNDLEKDLGKSNTFIKILIMIGVLVLLTFIVILINKYLNLELF